MNGSSYFLGVVVGVVTVYVAFTYALGAGDRNATQA